ncbi:MAG: NTP transferase domain-containing protein [Ferrovibrio sp.]|uniref:cytidylyltransferase domain-containing protein n=1 Tax=Ferrovibrio sp. TaxID=1917215 RepID=UPI0026208158|nr:NTP transferase domain-containing protein [Ferrovibrio sp.]MCW0234929.1 NTP transferase domain-containing protein [Ferrovibrio sp.]
MQVSIQPASFYTHIMAETSKPLDRTTAVVLFGRFNSSRLPGKVLLPLGDRPMLGRVIDRMRLLSTPARIIVATSDQPDDDGIASFAESEAVDVFRGDKNDVLARAVACVDHFKLDRFVRICCDSPFMDTELVDHLLALHAEENAELATNMLPRSYPFGISVEILTAGLTRRLDRDASDPEDREHLTRFCYRFPERFHIARHSATHERYIGLRLVVDTPEDYARAEAITRHLGVRPETATLDQVVAAASANQVE